MWIKIDDNLPDHPKIVAAGPDAAWLYVCGLCFCNRFLTDGLISERQARRLADFDNPIELADRLIDAGLWEQAAGGYLVHDYLEHQNSKERIDAIKHERTEAGSRGGKQKAFNKVANTQQFASDLLQQSSSKSLADKEEELRLRIQKEERKEEEETGAIAPAQATDNFTEWFNEFWELYPKKVRKQAAVKVARRIAARDWDDVVASVKHYVLSTKPLEGFIKEPPGYLTDGYWKDYVDGPRIERKGTNGQDKRRQQLDDATRDAFGAGLDEIFPGGIAGTATNNQAGGVRQLPGRREAS